MKSRIWLVLLLSTAACGKSSDLGHMRAEANGYVAHFDHELAELQERSTALAERKLELGTADAPGSANAENTAQRVKSGLIKLRNMAHNAPDVIAKAESKEKLVAAMGQINTDLEHGVIETRTSLDAYERFLEQLAESKNEPAKPEPAKTEEPKPTEGGSGSAAEPAAGGSGSAAAPEAGSGAAAGSAAAPAHR